MNKYIFSILLNMSYIKYVNSTVPAEIITDVFA
jgi:hypothetical protein